MKLRKIVQVLLIAFLIDTCLAVVNQASKGGVTVLELEDTLSTKVMNFDTSKMKDEDVQKLLIHNQAQLFLSKDYGKKQTKLGNTPNTCIFSCKEFGCSKVKKVEVIMIENYFYNRCKPVLFNAGFECPCFYLFPLASAKKKLKYMRNFSKYLQQVCNSQFVCQNDSPKPAVTYFNEYYATKGDVTVVGFNNKVEGQEKKEEVPIPEEKVPQEVQIVQTIVSKTSNNEQPPVVHDSTRKPDATVKPDEPQCAGTIPYKFDIIKYASAEEIRQRALERCKHQDVYVYFSCVFDSSLGVHKTKQEYEEVAKIISKVLKGNKICASQGDPHYIPFHGKKFDIYGVQGPRLLYKKNDLEINTNLFFSKRWGRNGVNNQVEVKYKNNVFLVDAAVDKKFPREKNSGFQVRKEVLRNNVVVKYTINVGIYSIIIESFIDGYLNVFLTVPSPDSVGCSGDCCQSSPINVDKSLTFAHGDPFLVEFKSACYRKAQHVEICVKKYPSSFSLQYKCVQEYAERN